MNEIPDIIKKLQLITQNKPQTFKFAYICPYCNKITGREFKMVLVICDSCKERFVPRDVLNEYY